MAEIDKLYSEIGTRIINEGVLYDDPNRPGTQRIEVPFVTAVYNMSTGFPLLTTKKLFWRGIVTELLWFLQGNTNVGWLAQQGVNFWNKDAYSFYKKNVAQPMSFERYEKKLKNGEATGYCGPIYGKLWRDFNGVDQIQTVFNELQTNPNSTRLVVNSWDPSLIKDQALPPCHMNFQFTTSGNKLNLSFVMRSSDYFHGLPFNIASYALLLQIFCELLGYEPGKLAWLLNNAHVYTSHIPMVEEQLRRDALKYNPPTLRFKDLSRDFNEIKPEQILLENYESYGNIKAKMQCLQ